MLRFQTSADWTQCVLDDFDTFLLDHAACEKKASSMAMAMVSHYPDKPDLIRAMIDLAIEELSHYRDVFKILDQRGLALSADVKDPYVIAFRQSIRQGTEEYLLDRLLIAAIIEARGHERFGLIADALEAGSLKQFYIAITRSECRHYELFLDIAKLYIPEATITTRLDQLLDREAEIVSKLPLRAALH